MTPAWWYVALCAGAVSPLAFLLGVELWRQRGYKREYAEMIQREQMGRVLCD